MAIRTSRGRRNQGRHGLWRGIAGGTAALLAVAAAFGSGLAASAATPVSQATGQMLSGQLAGLDLTNIATLGIATATNTGGATDTHTAPIAVGALGDSVMLDLGTITLPLSDVIQLGALNQYASAAADGTADGASGLVTDTGAITTSPNPTQSIASFDLSQLLPSTVTGTVGNVTLGVGTIAATADQTPAGVQSGDFTLADVNAGIQSPLVAGVSTTLTSTLNSALGPVLALVQALGVVNNVPNVGDLVASIGDVTSADGCLTANINTGQVNVNLDCVAEQDLGVSALSEVPAHTDLGVLLAQEVTQQLPSALGGAITQLQQSLTAALNGITIGLPPLDISLGSVNAGLLNQLLTTVTGTLSTVTAGLGTSVVEPLATVVSQVLGIIVNDQTTSGDGTFTETALSVNVLPGLGNLGQVNLATASVGPGTGALPDAPAITAPADGSSTTDTTPTISGTGTAGDTVTVTDSSDATVCTATVQGDGTWSCTPATAMTLGAQTLTATQSDAAGGVSAPSAPDSFTIAALPAAPAISAPVDGSSTANTTPAITGTGTAGDTVTVTEGATALCTATVQGDGTWSCTPSTPLATGAHTISATQTDADSNVSPASTAVTFTVVPVAPAITSPADGSSTTDSTPTVSGTGTPGDTVTVSSGATAVCTATVQGDGTWSCTPTTPLPDGTDTLTATQADAGGDTSAPSGPVDVTIVPAAPVITEPVDGSTTADATPTIMGTGTAGDTVTVAEGATTLCTATVQGDGGWSCTPTTDLLDGPHTIAATQAAPDGTESSASDPDAFIVDTSAVTVPPAPAITAPADGSSTDDPTPTISGTGVAGDVVTVVDGGTAVCTATVQGDGTWSCTPTTPLPEGSNTLTATQADGDGNTSAASAPVVVTVLPAAPVISAPADGSSTTDATPTVSGTGTPGDTVTVVEGATTLCTATVQGDGTWTCDVTTPLGDGAHSVTATQADAGGDVSDPSAAVGFAVVPVAPAITAPADGSSTTDSTPTISGTGIVGDTVTVVEGATTLCTATVQGDGTWTCDVTAPLADGAHSVTATQADGDGNTSPASTAIGFTVTPVAPAITAPADGSSTTDATPTVSGTGTPGDTVTVLDGATTVCTATVQGDGTWSCTPTTPLPEGSNTLTATQADGDGNTSPASDPVTITVTPEAPAITAPADGGTTTDQTPTISGTGTPGDTVTVTEGATTLCTATVQGDGTWSCDVTTALGDGAHSVTATQADGDGNVSPASTAVGFTVVPEAPAITAPTDGSSTTDATPTVSGTGTPGDTVTVVEGATTLCTATVQGDGTWSCDVTTALAVGPHSITATQADGDGNTSPASTAVAFTVTAVGSTPPAPSITAPADGSSTSDSTPDISGTGTVGDTVTVSDGGTTVCTATVQGDGSWSCTPTTPLPEGSNTLTATQNDGEGGDTSPASAPVVITVTPPAPVITAPAPGASTTDDTPLVSGTGEPGDTVTVTEGATVVCTATVLGDGSWSCTPATPFANGLHTLLATQADAGGDVSPASAPEAFTVVPPAPAITAPSDGSNTSDTTPTVTGTGDPGDTVTVSDGGSTVCTATVQPDGSWSCTPGTPLGDGSHTLTATQADGAGNTSPASAGVSLTIVSAAACTAAPSSVSITPNSGPTTGGTATIVTGTGYVGVESVQFGDTDATSFQVTDANHIGAVAPPHAAGTVELHITTPCGVDPVLYTYYAAGEPLGSALASTGQNLWLTGIAAGLAALLAGGAILIGARRRRVG